jgi:hypothetical protein
MFQYVNLSAVYIVSRVYYILLIVCVVVTRSRVELNEAVNMNLAGINNLLT